MKPSGWKTVALVIVVAAVAWWLTTRRGPDERLAARFAQLCDIAGDNLATPARGVDRLMALFADRSPDMLHDVAELVVDTARIGDEARHDRRAREARERMRAPLRDCADTLSRFAEAVDADPEAHDKLSRGLARLSRTLQLLFGDEDSTTMPRDLRDLLTRLGQPPR